MSERYTRLFALPENLGVEDCPVVISAGALLKDNITGNVLAQLKLRNLSPQEVKAVTVRINAYDIAGTELDGVDAFSYLDLNIPLDGEFGSQTPILLPDADTRSLTIDILTVAFADGTIYSPVESQATRTADGNTLEKIIELDNERAVQVRRENRKRLLYWLLVFLGILLLCGVAVFLIRLLVYLSHLIWR